MTRFNWIMKEIYKDGKKNLKWLPAGAADFQPLAENLLPLLI